MSAWPTIPLGNAVELAYGKGLPARARRPGCIPVYGSNGIAGYHDEPIVFEPTIIVGRKGSVGAIHLVEGPSYPIDTTFYIRRRDGIALDLSFLAIVLERLELGTLAITTGVPGLSRETAYSQQVPLPPLDEQRRIVDLLNRAAGIRRLREQALAKARALVPALFLDMFGDPATNPKGWPVAKLGEVIAGFQGGRNLSAGDEDSTSYRILKISAVTGGYFRPDQSKPAPAEYEPPSEHLIRADDLLITRANTVDLVGAVAHIADEHPNLVLPDKIWRFLWQEPSLVLSPFVEALFRTDAVRAALRLMATGTSDSMRNISQRKLLGMEIVVPPIDLQRAFAEHVEEARAVVEQHERGLNVAQNLERSLQSTLLGA